MNNCFVIVFVSTLSAVIFNLKWCRGYINKSLRKQLAQNINICDNLSIFEPNVPPSNETPIPFEHLVEWFDYSCLTVFISSRIRLSFPIAVIQVRDDTDCPIGNWLLENITEHYYYGYKDEKTVSCASKENDTLYIYNNRGWKRAGAWIPSSGFSNYSNSTVHMSVYYTASRWFRTVDRVPYRSEINDTSDYMDEFGKFNPASYYNRFMHKPETDERTERDFSL